MENFGEGVRKVLLAGIGAVAVTAEKSQDVLEDLVKKGELTVEQGKVLNEELKHNVKEKVKEKMKDNVTINVNPSDPETFLDVMDDMTQEQLQKVKEKINEMETSQEDTAGEDNG